MLCAFKYNQTLVYPITTRGASNISPVSHPQLAMPAWAGPRGSLALLEQHVIDTQELICVIDTQELMRYNRILPQLSECVPEPQIYKQ